MDWQIWAAKYFGSAFGVLLSMLFVAPATSRNALYRILFAPIAGVIFSPAIQNLLWFLQGPGLEHHMAAACAAGFTCWFVLEYPPGSRWAGFCCAMSRFMSRRLAGRSGERPEIGGNRP